MGIALSGAQSPMTRATWVAKIIGGPGIAHRQAAAVIVPPHASSRVAERPIQAFDQLLVAERLL